MDKDQVADILDEIGTLLALQGENSFRCNAYHAGARAIHQLEGDLASLVAENKLKGIPGIGDTLREKITTLVQTGSLPFYNDLRAKFPPTLFDLLRLPGLGAKKVKALYEELNIDSVDKLKASCLADEVAKLKGFGAKTQQKILEGIDFLSAVGHRVRIDEAGAIAEGILAALRKGCPGIIRMEACGSLRRRRETIGDIDILVSAKEAGPIMDFFAKLPGVAHIVGQGDTKSSVMIDQGRHEGRQLLMNADLRIVSDEQFPFALHYFTGGKEHNIAIRARAQEYGLKLNEYALAGAKKNVACKDEADIFRALDLDYIPPEMRENTGEIEAAAQHKLPDLVELTDLQGTFHCHTDWSDGANTLAQMAEAAKQLGFKYLGIADHSQSLTVARGLNPDRVKKQHEEIDSLNDKLKGIHLFKGIECDILADGSLDYTDDILESFDFIVASVHSHFNQPQDEMTARILRAIEHPRVTMLGHATGRLLLRRDGYKVDMDAILHKAAENGTIVEINSHPHRLDIDWIHCKRAKHLGVKLAINPDAHSTDELALVKYGIDVARRGWLEKVNVFNTRTQAQIAKAFKTPKHARLTS